MGNTLKGTTKTGFAYQIREEALDDMELLDAIAEIDGNPLAISKVIKMLLGEQQRKELYEHLRGEDGRVSVKAASEAIADIFSSSGQQGKN